MQSSIEDWPIERNHLRPEDMWYHILAGIIEE
jgi:hypothetical protein